MEGSTFCADITIENIICTPCSFSQSCEGSCTEHEQHTYSYADEKAMPQKAIDVSSVGEKDDLIVKVLGVALSEILHVNDASTSLVGGNPTLDQDVICSPKEIPPLSLDTNMKKGSNECGSPLTSEEDLSCSLLSINRSKELSSMSLHNQSFPEDEASVPVHSLVLPATMKLVSALKGGREKQGMPPKMKLGVKWAPDVYDPPVTSSSHTVKGNHYRSKAKKKDHHKHKHSKSKSSRGSSSERKHMAWRSTYNMIDSQNLRFQAVGDGMIGFSQPNVEVLDYKVVSHELKCGSSYYMESLANVHLPIAEAS